MLGFVVLSETGRRDGGRGEAGVSELNFGSQHSHDDVEANKTGSDSVRRSFQVLLRSRSLFLHAYLEFNISLLLLPSLPPSCFSNKRMMLVRATGHVCG